MCVRQVIGFIIKCDKEFQCLCYIIYLYNFYVFFIYVSKDNVLILYLYIYVIFVYELKGLIIDIYISDK